MKRTVIGQALFRIFAIFLAALLVFYVACFLFIRSIVREDAEQISYEILRPLGALTEERSERKQIPFGKDFEAEFLDYSDTLFKNESFEYTFMYIPDTENNTIHYVALTSDENHRDWIDYIKKNNMALDYTLNQTEREVWEGKREVGFVALENNYGHELETTLTVTDCTGQRAILGVDFSFSAMMESTIRIFTNIAIHLFVLFAVLMIVLYFILRRRIAAPVGEIVSTMQQYIVEGKRSDKKLPENGQNEFSAIAGAFNQMTDDIDRYLENIRTLNDEKLRSETEMNIVARIQQGFLPAADHIGSGYEIHAFMRPARDVGGDIFDYVPLDDNRILILVADVSGKGLSASIFMAATLIILRQYVKMDLSPAAVLAKTNDSLASKNPETLFVTAFVGIYDRRDKTFTYANAGHNPPYLLSENKLTALNGAGGTLLGLFPGESYEEQTLTLSPGDQLFLYTDGVTEAIDPENHFFGTDRLEQTLQNYSGTVSGLLTDHIRSSLDGFMNDARQNDDITVMTLSVTAERRELLLDYDAAEFRKIREAVLATELPDPFKRTVCLAAEELFVNICSYTFPDGAPAGEKIRVLLTVRDDVRLRFEDGGTPYDPRQDVVTAEEYDIDAQEGGLGKLITFGLVDKVDYEYTDHKNIVTITKHREETL